MKYNELKITKEHLSYEILGTMQKSKNTLTVKNFRKQLETLEYDKFYDSIGGRNARNEDLEGFRIPAIVYKYYYLLITTGKIPTIEELCNSYIETYVEETKGGYQVKKEYRASNKNVVFSLNDLKGRICRGYNSFHREVDLLLQLFEKYGNEFEFFYSFNEDYFNGVDIVATSKNGKRYDIATYFSSKRSLQYKNKKNNETHNYKNATIDLLAYFEGPEKNVIKVGDVKLYNNKAVDYIYSELTKKRA